MKTKAILLIDVDNHIGPNALPTKTTARLTEVLHRAGGGVEAVASCPEARTRPESASILRKQGVRLVWSGPGKNAADHVLLKVARAAHAGGVERFLVASADAAFAELSDLGRLEVIAREDQPIAQALRKAASAVHVVPQAARPAPASPTAHTISQKAVHAGSASTQGGVPKPRSTAAAGPAERTASRTTSPGNWPPKRPAFAVAGVVAALFLGGLALGAGTALGSRATHGFLDRHSPRPPRS